MKHLCITPGIALLFFAALLPTFPPVFADCFVPMHCSRAVNGDRLIVSCREGREIKLIDTITIDEQTAALKREIDSAAYCFQGRIDSIIPFRTPPNNGDPCISYLVDSVHVNVIAAYKGAVPDGYWFIDTIIAGYCDTTKEVWIEDGDPGYENILHRYRFIAFTNEIGTLRRSNVRTGACGFRGGYYIDTLNSTVNKMGLEHLKTEGSYMVMDYYDRWIMMPLSDFIDIIGTVAAAHAPGLPATSGETFTLVRRSGEYRIISLKNQQLSLTTYGLDGRIYMNRSVNCRAGEPIYLSGNGTATPGVRLVGISDGKTTPTFRLAAW